MNMRWVEQTSILVLLAFVVPIHFWATYIVDCVVIASRQMWFHSFIRSNFVFFFFLFIHMLLLLFLLFEFHFWNAKMIISNDILLIHFTISSKNSEIAALLVLRSHITRLTCSYRQVNQALDLLFTSVPNAHKIRKKKKQK